MTSPNTGRRSIHWATENSWRARPQIILGSYLTSILHTARITNVKIVLYGERIKDGKFYAQ